MADTSSDTAGRLSLAEIYGTPERLWIAYWCAQTAALGVAWSSLDNPVRALLGNLALMAGIVVVPQITRRLNVHAQHLGHIFLTFLSFLLSFERIGMMLPALNPTSYELTLLRLDHLLFGGNPSEWVQALHHPALTEYLQLIYVWYFPAMLTVGLVFWWRRQHEDFYEYLVAMNFAFTFLHISYLLFPARSPFLVAEVAPFSDWIRYTFPLEGLWYADRVRQHLLEVTVMKYDCFPSGHTMGMVLASIYAARAGRATFLLTLIITVSIVFSTLYLRYHYGIDLILGAVTAVLWYRFGAWFVRRERASGELPSLQAQRA